MKNVCVEHLRLFESSARPSSGVQLKNVAQAFVALQEKRHTADYNNAYVWARTNAVFAIDTASAAFLDWRAIRSGEAAQDYLLQLFLPKMPRGSRLTLAGPIPAR